MRNARSYGSTTAAKRFQVANKSTATPAHFSRICKEGSKHLIHNRKVHRNTDRCGHYPKPRHLVSILSSGHQAVLQISGNCFKLGRFGDGNPSRDRKLQHDPKHGSKSYETIWPQTLIAFQVTGTSLACLLHLPGLLLHPGSDPEP